MGSRGLDSDAVGLEGEYPLITTKDAAIYLAEILPQLARLAKQGGLQDIGEMVSLAAKLASRESDQEQALQ